MVSSYIGSSAETGRPPGDRRASLRQLCNWEGYCERTSGSSDQLWWFARVRDLSAHGIGLLLKHRFEPGTQLLVEVGAPEQHRSQRFRARVAHATPEPDGWLMGCEFVNALEGEER